VELYETYDNPAPDGATMSAARAGDGVRLRVASWPPTAPAAGTVLLAQGRAEMIEKYFETVGELRARGFHVVAFDWRGQGGSDRLLRDGRKGHVRDFDEYEDDLRAVVAAELASRPRPWFGLFHSMGACIALSAARKGDLPLERMVCLAPMVAIHNIRNPKGVLWLARTLCAAGLTNHYIPGGGPVSIATKPYPGNPLTSDENRYARNALIASAFPQLAIGDPTIGWTRAAFTRMAALQAPGFAEAIAIPALVLTAGEDRVVSTPAAEAFAARLGSGGVISIAGGRHELLMESDVGRAQVLAAIDAFFERAPTQAERRPA